MDRPNLTTEVEIVVPFFDVDAMEVAWHGHYVKYMEQARCQLLDLINYNYNQMKQSGFIWPVVDMRIKYIKPLRFQQVIIVQASFAELEYGLKIEFLFIDKLTGDKLTKAYTKQVAVNLETREMSILSPQILMDRFNSYQAKQ